MNDLIKANGLSLDQLTTYQDCYTAHVRDFVKWCKERGQTEIYDDIVRDYFVELNQSSYKAGTIRIKRAGVKKRIRQLMEHAPIDAQVRLDRVLSNLDNFGDTRAPKVASRAIRPEKVISESERAQLIAAATPRLALMMEFLWVTGCRINEMTTARVADCVVENGVADVRVIGKGSKERHVIITEALYQKIRAFYRGEEYLFETSAGGKVDNGYVTKQIKKLGARVLGRSISAHSYRHSFATRKIRNTGNLKGVSQYLGHSSTSITSDMYDHNLLATSELLEEDLIGAPLNGCKMDMAAAV